MVYATPDDMATRIRQLFTAAGTRPYAGEAVTQAEHGLQCAALALEEGASRQLIVAALLHDIGHMIDDRDEALAASGVDAQHELGGARLLTRWFAAATTEPVRLHVQAKAYLCYADPDYFGGLSPVSKRSLRLQGGIMSEGQAKVFMTAPFSADAVRLRRWDDLAKIPGRITPPLERFLRMCAEVAA